MYYDTLNNTYGANVQSVQLCTKGTFVDLLTNNDLGLLSYGVVPDSGTDPGDLASISTTSPGANRQGPCKPWFDTTAGGAALDTVNIQPCTLYTAGRKIIYPGGSVVVSGGINGHYMDVYIDATGTVQVGSSGTNPPGGISTSFNAQAPIVHICMVYFSAAGTIGEIYDTRVFTDSTKFTATVQGASAPGYMVSNNTGGYLNATSLAAGSGDLVGIIADTNGSSSTSNANAVVITSGPAEIYGNSYGPTAGSTVVSAPSTGYPGYGQNGTSSNVYGYLGVALNNAFVTSNSGDGSALVNVKIR
jgi:hypothetical protein